VPGQALQEACQTLEELALTVVALDKDDLPTTGEILEKVESILAGAKEVGEEGLTQLAGALKVGLEKLILGEIDEPGKFIELLPETIAVMQDLCQELVREGRGGQAPDGLSEKINQTMGLNLPPDQAVKATEPEGLKPMLTPDEDRELIQSFISDSLDLLQEIEISVLAVEQDPEDMEAINAIFRPFHTIKGVSGFLNLAQINHTAHAVENLLEEARVGRMVLEGAVVDLVLDAVDLLRVLIADASTRLQTGQPTDEDFGVEAFLQRIARVRALALKSQAGESSPLGEIMIGGGELSEKDLEESLVTQRKLKEPLGAVLVREGKVPAKVVARGLRNQRIRQAEAGAVKVETAKLDNMIDMIGELAVALSVVTQNPELAELKEQRIERDMAQLDRITAGLQKTAMSLRMLPVRQTFQRMVRLTRDLSQKSGKKVELSMEGQDTKIDRSMVEAISDPLVHMVRNSVDHGLEAAEERRAAGKPEAGKVTLKAYHQGGRIVIEVEDDGKGLDVEKILAKAIDRGLVASEAELTESEVYRLIMQPGFSTAEKVTDISGRGVGMDVVKAAVEKLRGHLEIASEKGRYTRFTIRLPLTMAVIEGMIVGLGGERFIIPTLGIEEAFKPEGRDLSTGPGATGKVMLRGRLLPLLRLGKLFGLTPPPSKSGSFEGVVVVVVSESQRKAVMVDELLGKQEVVVKSLGAGLKELRGLTGGAILGDGRVGLILDIKELFLIAAEERGSGGIRAESVVEGRPAPGAGEDGLTSETGQ